MTTQVVFPSNAGMGGRPQAIKNATPPAPKPLSAAKANLLSRLRNPPRPQIQVDKAQLKKQLTPLEYRVTQEKFTERPFSGEYLKMNDDGVYCCKVCGEEIFSSECKFDSGCGWPAFSSVVQDNKVIQQADLSHVGGNLLLLALNEDLARTEVQCAKCGSHLGHVFQDGPKPTGKRYCVNSASLKFRKECKQSKVGDCDTPSASVVDTNSKLVPSEKVVPNTRRRFASKSVERPRNPPPPPPAIKSKCVKVAITQAKMPASQSIAQPVNEEKVKSCKDNAKLDWNNNSVHVITPKKYKSVQSRYLNHLEQANKQNVVRIYTFPKAAALNSDDKKVLETNL